MKDMQIEDPNTYLLSQRDSIARSCELLAEAFDELAQIYEMTGRPDLAVLAREHARTQKCGSLDVKNA